MNGETSLYRHFDSEGNLLYVGISLSAVMRLAEHETSSRWFNQIARVEIEHFLTKQAAIAAERQAILAECPAHNVLHNPKPTLNGMGARIRELRLARRMTQVEIARACGVTRSAVCQWELGGVENIKLLSFLKLLELLETDANYLLDITEAA